MERLFLAAGALSGGISVAAGAFAAHALRARLSPDHLAAFQTGAQYQMTHALAMLACGLLLGRSPGTAPAVAGLLFLAGTVLFSGSLYALGWTGIRAFGAVTPLGGLAFLAGWAALLWAALSLPAR